MHMKQQTVKTKNEIISVNFANVTTGYFLSGNMMSSEYSL